MLAAGDGGRLGVHTASTPKPLVHVGGRPIISYTLEALRQAGITQAAVVLGYRGVQVRDALLRDSHGLRLDFAWNAEFRGGASLSLRAARSRVGNAPITATVAKKDPAAAAAKAAEAEVTTGYIPPELRPRTDGFKWGENGVEGKCAVCGTYVIKGGVKFREKSVLCAEDAARQAKIANPYGASAGRR